MARAFLSSGQQAQLARLSEQQMPDSATILTPTETSDGRGGVTVTFAEGSTVACRMRPTTERTDQIEGGQPGTQELFIFALPVSTEIESNYRLRRNEIDYEIVGFPTDGSHQISKKVLTRRV